MMHRVNGIKILLSNPKINNNYWKIEISATSETVLWFRRLAVSTIAEAHARTKTILCGICGRQRGNGRGFSPRTWVFLVTTIPPALHTHSPVILLTQSEKLTARINNTDRMGKLLLKLQREGTLRNISRHKTVHALYVLHELGSKSNL